MCLTKKRTALLTGSSIAAAGFTACSIISVAVTKKLVDIAMDRSAPFILTYDRRRLSGSGIRATALEEAAVAKECLEQAGTETVQITSHDGILLVGHWRPCQNPRRIILAMHGWRSSWASDFGIISDFWLSQNCSVLYAEQRGQGASSGDYMGFGLIERHDCLDWVNWINRRTNASLPIYLAGVSMGASTVLMASALSLPRNVCGIMADCGYTSVHAIWKHVAVQNLHLPYGLHSFYADRMCRKKIHTGTKSLSTVDSLQKNQIPVLFVHGTDDRFVPVEMTYENYRACIAPKRLFLVPGAGHGMSYFVDRPGYEQESMAFWADCEAAQP